LVTRLVSGSISKVRTAKISNIFELGAYQIFSSCNIELYTNLSITQKNSIPSII
jgi:hypothetical protein